MDYIDVTPIQCTMFGVVFEIDLGMIIYDQKTGECWRCYPYMLSKKQQGLVFSSYSRGLQLVERLVNIFDASEFGIKNYALYLRRVFEYVACVVSYNYILTSTYTNPEPEVVIAPIEIDEKAVNNTTDTMKYIISKVINETKDLEVKAYLMNYFEKYYRIARTGEMVV